MKNLLVSLALMSTLMTGCAAGPQYSAVNIESAQAMSLVAVDSKYFDQVFVGDLALIDGTRKVFIETIDLDSVAIDQPDSVRHSPRSEWVLSGKDKAGIEALYHKSLRKQFEQAGYTLVSAPAADVLVVDGKLLALDPSAPKDDIKSRSAFERYVSQGAGNATLAIEISLAEEIVLKLEDKRDAGSEWELNDRFHNAREVRQLFGKWARGLVHSLS